MDVNALPRRIPADGGHLPAQTKKTLSAYMKSLADVEAAARAENAASAALDEAKVKDKLDRPDTFEAIEAAEGEHKRAGWARERAKQAAIDSYVAHLAAIEREKDQAIAGILGEIEEQRQTVEDQLRGARDAIGVMQALKSDRDYLVAPNKRGPGGAWTQEMREAAAPLPLPPGFRELIAALGGVLDPPPDATHAAQARVWDPSRGRTMEDARLEGLAEPLPPQLGGMGMVEVPTRTEADRRRDEAAAAPGVEVAEPEPAAAAEGGEE